METLANSMPGPEEAVNPAPSPADKNKAKHVCNLKTLESRKKFIDKVKDQFLKASSGMDDFGWDFVAEDQGVTITSAAIPGSPIRCAKGESVIRGSIQDLYKLVCDITNWKTWDTKVSEARTVKELDADNKINYLAYGPVFPVSARDVLFLQSTFETTPGEKIVLWSSVIDDDFPPKYGVIRAKFKSSGFVIREIAETGNCMVTFVLQFDLKGWIPVQVMNAVTVSQPMVLRQLEISVKNLPVEATLQKQTSKPSIVHQEAEPAQAAHGEGAESKSKISLSIPKNFLSFGDKKK